jgi:urease gamma subunit
MIKTLTVTISAASNDTEGCNLLIGQALTTLTTMIDEGVKDGNLTFEFIEDGYTLDFSQEIMAFDKK